MAIHGNNKVVAIVDDDDAVRVALEGLLKSAGLTARAFESAETFIESGQQSQVACLIADIRMPGMSGLELQAKLNAEHCRIPIIFITASTDKTVRPRLLEQGAVECLFKPFSDTALLKALNAALRVA